MSVRRHPIAIAAADRPDRLASLPIDLALCARLRATYLVIRSERDRLAEIFYRRLFDAAPEVRPLFRADAATQSAKLMAALDAVVAHLEQPARTAAMLEELGRRHARYGARPEHYPLVIDLLVASMEELLGPAAGAASLGEWRTALSLVAGQMLAAAAGEPSPPAHAAAQDGT
jgi:hemoglobin-like flavoprotein